MAADAAELSPSWRERRCAASRSGSCQTATSMSESGPASPRAWEPISIAATTPSRSRASESRSRAAASTGGTRAFSSMTVTPASSLIRRTESRPRPGVARVDLRLSRVAASHGATEGTHPLRRRRHSPASDNPHLGEAARACRQQTRALLRDRGAGRCRGEGDRDHHRPRDRRGDSRGRRRRLPVRRRDHLHRPGRTGRAGPRGADRRGVHRRLPVRHVPRRQPPARRPARPRPDLRRALARRADPADAGRGARALRGRRARRRADRAADREAQRPALQPRAGRRLPLHPGDLRCRPRPAALLARGAGDHRGDPGPDRRRPPGPLRGGQRLVEGHRPAGRHAGGQPARARGAADAPRRDGR